MRLILLTLILCGYLSSNAQYWTADASVYLSSYPSLSLGVEKRFEFGDVSMGVRAEIVRPMQPEYYQVLDTFHEMNYQFRLRMIQVEYRVNE